MICRLNQLTGFYMMATLTFNDLKLLLQQHPYKNLETMK